MSKPSFPHLKSSKDLETTYEAVRAGFVSLALEKNRQATPYIQESFKKMGHTPHLFFIGAAIEAKMAGEIWNLLKRGTLSNAANLTDDDQVASLSRWLCNL